MTHYQVPREETCINLTNISEQVYCKFNTQVDVELQNMNDIIFL